jgi:hypothetical protein
MPGKGSACVDENLGELSRPGPHNSRNEKLEELPGRKR